MPAKWQQWMPFKIDAFRGSSAVQAMHPAARAGYLYLLSSAWQSEDCTIPADPLELAEMSGLGDELWQIHGPRILRKFSPNGRPDRLQNPVLVEEWKVAKKVFDEGQVRRDELSRKRSEAGKSGNEIRWNRKNDNLRQNYIANESQPDRNDIANDRYTGTSTGTGTYTGTETKTKKPLGRFATRIPIDFSPKIEHVKMAENLGLDLPDQMNRFRDHWTAKAGRDATKADWDATLRNWLRKAADMGQSRGNGHAKQNGNGKQDYLIAMLAEDDDSQGDSGNGDVARGDTGQRTH